MNDLSVAIGVGKKLDTSQHVVVDFDGAQTVNYSEQEGQSASYTSPTYTVTFYKDNEIYSSQIVKFGETAVVPEIPLYYRLMGYFAWSPDLTGKKIYQDATSTLVKKTDTLVISLYDNDHAQDVSDIAAII